MKPSPFTYHRPHTVAEAVRQLAALGEDGKVLAGGQSLVPLMSMRLSAPEHLVDINGIDELDTVEVTRDHVRVGAGARQARVERDSAVRSAAPLIGQALSLVAHAAIRNRGTVVGSLVHADPASELSAVLRLLGGTVELRSADGPREIDAADFFLGPMSSQVGPGELAVAARFLLPPARSGTAFVEVSRRHGDFALCGVAALVVVDEEGALISACAALVGVAPAAVRVDLTPAGADSGRGLDPRAGGDRVDAAIDPESDIHATADYRRQLAKVLTARAVAAATDRARTRDGSS